MITFRLRRRTKRKRRRPRSSLPVSIGISTALVYAFWLGYGSFTRRSTRGSKESLVKDGDKKVSIIPCLRSRPKRSMVQASRSHADTTITVAWREWWGQLRYMAFSDTASTFFLVLRCLRRMPLLSPIDWRGTTGGAVER
jgi:hypothetical protein